LTGSNRPTVRSGAAEDWAERSRPGRKKLANPAGPSSYAQTVSERLDAPDRRVERLAR
jgi:hypothetical protein